MVLPVELGKAAVPDVLSVEPEDSVMPLMSGGNTTTKSPLMVAPVAGMALGARFGVRYSPVLSVLLVGVPKPGGMRAAFLLTSSFFCAPPSAVTTGSTEVGLP